MEPFSFAVAKIEMIFETGSSQVICGTGTSFFYKSAERPFLITNWHNVTGVNPISRKAIHTHGMLPNILRVYFKQWANSEKSLVKSASIDIPLFVDGAPVWFEHSTRMEVDVVAVPLEIDRFKALPANSSI